MSLKRHTGYLPAFGLSYKIDTEQEKGPRRVPCGSQSVQGKKALEGWGAQKRDKDRKERLKNNSPK
jgi:hypothetical protein